MINNEFLSYKFNLHPIIIDLLIKRGLNTEDKISSFLYDDFSNLESPHLFQNLDDIVKLIKSHIKKESKILIFGDYDCDGICASAMLYLSLFSHTTNVEVFIPSRIDGYGLALENLDEILDKYDPQLIITVDNGISAFEEVEYLNKKNIDVIITDHHTPKEDSLPNCLIMNPHLSPLKTPLCGTGVVFKLIYCLFGEKEAKKHIDLCAIATVADLVPLIHDNRILVKEGLRKINSFSKNLGLKVLCEHYFTKPDYVIKSSDIAFSIAPILNAAGRLSDAMKSFNLITATNLELANILANELILENEKRKDLTSKILTDAKLKIENYDIANNKIIILKDDWDEGVLGIVASSVSKLFSRPVILLTQSNNQLKGSCRSIQGVNILELLDSVNKYLEKYGGHSMAAGLMLKESKFSEFFEKINKIANDKYDFTTFLHVIEEDSSLDLKSINFNFYNDLMQLQPFGQGNHEPLFKLKAQPFKFNQIKNSNHIKQIVSHDLEMIYFNGLQDINLLNGDIDKNIYFRLDINHYFNTKLQLKITNVKCQKCPLSNNLLVKSVIDRLTPIIKENPYRLQNKFKHNINFGVLHLAYTNETFNKLIEAFPSFLHSVYRLDNYNNFNAVLLAPQNNLNYAFFHTIYIHDNPPEDLINFLNKKYGNKFQRGRLNNLNYLEFPPISIEILKKIFTYFNSNQKNSLSDLLLNETHPKFSKMQIYAAMSIFIELEIIHINNLNLLEIDYSKKNLEDSRIYNFLNLNSI